ncbi:MAG: four-carbon acid sugar kinase family protein [Candidatus Solibacter sp.]
MIDCLLVADDLTGACDAAVHFAARGLCPTIVELPGHTHAASARVLARSTESRDFTTEEIRRALQDLAAEFTGGAAARVFKKIDSTLRGNVGMEIAAARDAFGCDAVVVCPAFPAMGRVVEAGVLRVVHAAQFVPVDVAARLSAQAGEPCALTGAAGVAALLAEGARLIAADAATDCELDEIAAALAPFGKRVLWAGSAGLAAALARRTAQGQAGQGSAPPAFAQGPALFCLGSDHEVTLEQQAGLLAGRASVLFAHGTSHAAISGALAGGQHAILRIARGQIPEAIRAVRPAALVVSGGDTASVVFRALGAEAIELRAEIFPGVPLGTLRGGVFDRLPVVTKSGGFGARDTLIQVADFFHAIN